MNRSENRRSRQNTLAKVAAEIIAESGVEGATFREIALRAGVSKGVVEHYFSGKEDIIRKSLEWLNKRAQEREERGTKNKRGIEALRARVLALLPLRPELVREWKIRVHYWSTTIANRDDRLGMSIRITAARERFEEDIRQAISDGEVPETVDPLMAANMFLHIAAGVSCNMLLDPSHYRKDYQLRLVENLIMKLRSGHL